MRSIIDFHTHAFPDAVAARAIPSLEQAGGIKAATDGTIRGLLASMDKAGIATSVICSIATKIEQFQSILDWSVSVQSERIIPLPSVHPYDPELVKHIKSIKDSGCKGIKLHPYYQDFFLAEKRLDPLYKAVVDSNLLLVVHSGFDIAYPRTRRTDPDQFIRVIEKFPQLRIVSTHMGGWDDWREVERLLIGKPVYLEISFALNYLSPARARRMLMAHPADYLLFGSDSPWVDQSAYLEKLGELQLDHSLYEKIVRKNGERLLSNQQGP